MKPNPSPGRCQPVPGGRILTLPRSAPVLGRSNGESVEPWGLTVDLPACLHCCARDGRTPQTRLLLTLNRGLCQAAPIPDVPVPVRLAKWRGQV